MSEPSSSARMTLADESGRAALTGEEQARVLAARAKALASVEERNERPAETIEVVAFHVGGERYAIPTDRVDAILEIKGLCPLLGSPRHVLGAVVARTRVVPVVDLRVMLGLEGGGMRDLTKIVAVVDGEDVFGIAVEDVEGRMGLPKQPGPVPIDGPFLMVTTDRRAVLDVAKLSSP